VRVAPGCQTTVVRENLPTPMSIAIGAARDPGGGAERKRRGHPASSQSAADSHPRVEVDAVPARDVPANRRW
jgi:hypothetical protein